MVKDYKFRSVGTSVTLHEPIVLLGTDRMTIGNYVQISAFAFIAAGGGLYMGNFIHSAYGTGISGGGICIIDDFVGICAGAKIITGTDDISGKGIPTPMIPLDLHDEYRSFYRSYVYCGKHSFIGTNAVIHPGVSIGEGSVIGSGSVVTRDLEPWGIYLGAPAKRVKDRPKDIVLQQGKKLMEKLGLSESDFSSVLASARHGSI